jgi:protein-tyrosine-phosphatase
VAGRAAPAFAAAGDRAHGRLRGKARPLSVDEREFRVAFVCTGNRFRSPLAAALLEEETRGLPVRIASLGTLDLGGRPALPEAVEIASELGLDLSEHRARGLARVDLSRADLVLGFEARHIKSSVVESGAPRSVSFTLPELVGLLGRIPGPPLPSDPVERARVRVRQAHALRGGAEAEELGDPLGLTVRDQRRIAGELVRLTETLAERLFR